MDGDGERSGVWMVTGRGQGCGWWWGEVRGVDGDGERSGVWMVVGRDQGCGW